MKIERGFTLIELIIVIIITSVLAGIISFAVVNYLNSGKDASIAGNLVVLVPAGEVYYNSNNSSYEGFCSSDVVKNSKAQMPSNLEGSCYDEATNLSGVCCLETDDQWVACARNFSNPDTAFCVDSRGYKREIAEEQCTNAITPLRCPTSGL